MMLQEGHYIQESVDSRPIIGRNNRQPVLKVETKDFITSITRLVYTQEEYVLQLQNQTSENSHKQLVQPSDSLSSFIFSVYEHTTK